MKPSGMPGWYVEMAHNVHVYGLLINFFPLCVQEMSNAADRTKHKLKDSEEAEMAPPTKKRRTRRS